ncbi:UPF0669 protein v1g209471-like [Diadema setosum]|uniref:UPF0669 protein v1g209471-like n=1 Tax=Diadema setosum TaxID=31175 RepID=UPI003B3BB764
MRMHTQTVIAVYAALLEISACFVHGMEDYFYHLQTFEDVIGAGNYTYFKLTRPGNIRIFLQTLEGDADIYVSETTSKPTFEDYDLKSVTCGEDIVDVPDSFSRPTAIAIYGHPCCEESRFSCSVYVDTRDLSKGDMGLPPPGFEGDLEEEHPGWWFLLKVLEFILDVAL